MTNTERLRALLDKLGIEWKEFDSVHPITVWHVGQTSYEYMERTLLDGVTPCTGEVVDGTGRLEAVIHVCTPEQAIAATVGEESDMHICKRCGVAYELNIIDKGFGKPRFCPNCGYREIYQ